MIQTNKFNGTINSKCTNPQLINLQLMHYPNKIGNPRKIPRPIRRNRPLRLKWGPARFPRPYGLAICSSPYWAITDNMFPMINTKANTNTKVRFMIVFLSNVINVKIEYHRPHQLNLFIL